MTDCGCNNFPAGLGNVTFAASVGIGTVSPVGELHVASASTINANRGITTAQYSDSADAAVLTLRKARGTEANPGSVAEGDDLGNIHFQGYGTQFAIRAQIVATVGDDVDGDSVPTDLRFLTGSTSTTERVRVTSAGDVGIGTDSPQSRLEVAGGAVRVGGREVIDAEGYVLYG